MLCHLVFLSLIPGAASHLFGPIDQDPTPKPNATPAASQADASHVALAEWEPGLSGCVFPPDVADEAAYRQRVVSRTNELIAAAERAPDPHAKLSFHLAAANWILARQVEPAITRYFWGLAPLDIDDPLADLNAARQQLDAAENICETLIGQKPADQRQSPTDDPNDDPADTRRDLPARQALIADLAVFVDAISAVVRDGPSFDAEIAQDAALSLGILLEDERPGVADAATLYITMLYDRLNEYDRALSILPSPLSPIPRSQQTVPYLERLLRCRLIAHRGAPDVAWALLLRIEERSQEWFVSDQSRSEAFVSALWIRKEVADHWLRDAKTAPPRDADNSGAPTDALPSTETGKSSDGLTADDAHAKQAADQHAAWLHAEYKRMNALLEELGNEETMLRIGLAVPMLTEPPDAAAQTVLWPLPY